MKNNTYRIRNTGGDWIEVPGHYDNDTDNLELFISTNEYLENIDDWNYQLNDFVPEGYYDFTRDEAEISAHLFAEEGNADLTNIHFTNGSTNTETEAEIILDGMELPRRIRSSELTVSITWTDEAQHITPELLIEDWETANPED